MKDFYKMADELHKIVTSRDFRKNLAPLDRMARTNKLIKVAFYQAGVSFEAFANAWNRLKG